MEEMMKLLNRRCAGLDVHKDTVVAAARTVDNRKVVRELRRFETTTRGLLEMAEWLEAKGITHVAMEATGVYWKPVWHILEGRFALTLANPQHVRNVPGRKKDETDAAWIAELLAHGLITASFVPPRPIRELRELTRARTQLVRTVAQNAQRIDKVLQDANIKLSSVISDLMGPSGRRMLRAMSRGETDPAVIAREAGSRLKATPDQMCAALEGRLDGHHAFMLRLHLDVIEGLEARLAELDAQIDAQVAPFRAVVERVKTSPGFKGDVAAPSLVAEIGIDMSAFPSAGHLLNWARLVPRLDESAGKKRSRRVKKGGAWLKPLLVQCARAAVRTRRSYLRAQYHRLAPRIGDKKAIIAVAASMLTAIYHMIKNGSSYHDLGDAYFHRTEANQVTTAQRLARRIRALGYKVEISMPA
jgi:transposase